ncbi:MAG: hypothetical protein ABSA15_04665 [Thermoplasmata archaeon]|jgi:hypothetical protein
MVSLFFLPGVPTDTRSASDSIANLGANSTRSWLVSEVATYAGTLEMSWTSSAAVTVELSRTSTCAIGSGLCPAGPAIVAWYGNVTGQWSLNGQVGSTYLLTILNSGTAILSFSGTLTETFNVPTPSQAVPAWALITLGGLVLLGIGAIATFLGLFLPTGVYRPTRYETDGLGEETDLTLNEFGPDPP